MKTVETMSNKERVTLVRSELQPDTIRNHRVAEGLPVSPEQVRELENISVIAAQFAAAMGDISQDALNAPSSDRTMRTVRELLGTEPLYQSVMRGDTSTPILDPAEIIKTDIILTDQGMQIAEIEPGKIRGMGYAQMARMQANTPIGIGSEQAFMSLVQPDTRTAIVMSEADKFHEPEMNMLVRSMASISIAMQRFITTDSGKVVPVRGAESVDNVVMMSRFHASAGATKEQTVRELAAVVSDRRLDIESKGALALVHNISQNPELEALLLTRFDPSLLAALRDIVPMTGHSGLTEMDQFQSLRRSVDKGALRLFLKPLSSSGTRGIITPNQDAEITQVLGSHRMARKYVFQQAATTIPVEMRSMDVLNLSEASSMMNIRITMHSDRSGNIVELSVVGSPDKYLAHGGKTSVITNVEPTGE